MGFAMSVLEFLAFAFVGVVGTLLFVTIVLFVIDRSQTGGPLCDRHYSRGRNHCAFGWGGGTTSVTPASCTPDAGQRPVCPDERDLSELFC